MASRLLSGLDIPPSASSSSGGSTPAILETTPGSLESTAPTSPAVSSPSPTELRLDPRPIKPRLGFGTQAIHVGSEPDAVTGAVIPPISLSTTFAQKEPGVHSGFEYSRSDNPNRRALEAALAAVEEGGKEALAFSSGSAALATVIQSLQFLKKEGAAGHTPIHVLSINDVYGGTYRYLKRVASEISGLEVTFVDMETADEESVRSQVRDETKLILVETPTNPTLKIISIPLLSRIAHTHPSHPLLLVDNTFASPFYQNPLMLGADLVLHSLTKYVNGHSDVVMGAVVLPAVEGSHLLDVDYEESEEVQEGENLNIPLAHPSPTHLASYFKTLRFMQNALGAVPSAYDCWLAQRGLRTLHLRMRAHGVNALAVARGVRAWVGEARAAGVEDVDVKIGYAGLPPAKEGEAGAGGVEDATVQRRRHETAWSMLSRPARRFVEEEVRPLQELEISRSSGLPIMPTSAASPPPLGFPYTGMLTVTLPTYAHALTFLTSLHLFTLAESLGGVESLAEHPASMTHAGIPVEERRASGVEDGLVRLSVGVEDGVDLVRDVKAALGRAFGIGKVLDV